jgi:hypothetical protein
MEMILLAAAGSGAGARRIERRDPTTRAMRNAVAAWFSIEPARLASLDGSTVELMALRLEGRRSGAALRTGLLDLSLVGHPWAG